MADKEYSDEWFNDSFSLRGAEALRDKIKAYWSDRGFKIHAFIQQAPFHPTVRSGHYVVRSNLLNGMPRPSNAQLGKAA